MRPLFAYGGVGDMNSLIAKTFFAAKHDKDNIDMFLDPKLWKDYIHVSDFCNAVVIGSTSEQGVNQDFNVSAQTPRSVGEIVNIMSEMLGSDISTRIKWHPKTDYLGNHRLSSKKFRTLFNFIDELFWYFFATFVMFANQIKNFRLYNPVLHYLQWSKQ